MRRNLFVAALLTSVVGCISFTIVSLSQASTDAAPIRPATAVKGPVVHRPLRLRRIVIGQGISGVRLGEDITLVGRTLGQPTLVQPPAWSYGLKRTERVAFDSAGKVYDIWTNQNVRTRKGIGPGASLRRVVQAYPSSRCHGAKGIRGRICIVFTRYQGRSVETDFLFRRRLRSIEIAFLR